MSIHQLFYLNPKSGISLQKQIREQIVHAITNGQIPINEPLPSSRSLAKQLNVARNTVVLAYDHLLDDGYLITKPRSGYFINPDILEGIAKPVKKHTGVTPTDPIEWSKRLTFTPSTQKNISKPSDWKSYDYPFIYGQLNYHFFPTNNWRECCKDAVSVGAIKDWTIDHFDNDDPLLIEQIHTRLLPRRGIWVEPEQILVTVGCQHALYLLSRLLLNENSVMGLENPGYVDVRNIASLTNATLKGLPIDQNGLIINDDIDLCDLIYVTPSHQSPTTVTMPIKRRHELLKRAQEHDILLIEDDYESEINYHSSPLPALKSLDQNDRVIYVSSLSKTLSPGLRMGYIVGSVELIKELRALRRLMLRHPATNNERAIALFLARGYHDTLVRNLVHAYEERSQTLMQAFENHLPNLKENITLGSSSCWIQAHEQLDANELKHQAAKSGILIEPGDIHFLQEEPPKNFFRLGFSSIANEKITPGIATLAKVIRALP